MAHTYTCGDLPGSVVAPVMITIHIIHHSTKPILALCTLRQWGMWGSGTGTGTGMGMVGDPATERELPICLNGSFIRLP